MRNIIVLILVLAFAGCASQTEKQIKHLQKLTEITEIWQTAKEIHPAWAKLYPVCLIDGKKYTLYTPDENGEWKLTGAGIYPNPLPKGIKAAFRIPVNNYEMACVLDTNSFSTKEDMTIVFHEFVHCYQAYSCEEDIKSGLKVAQENQDTGGMWELQYPFPYDNELVGKTYIEMTEAAKRGDRDEVVRLRRIIQQNVSEQDWEYMCWQEFKEGTARWLQNVLSERLGAKPATSGHSLPINRVIFYEGGEMIIRLLTKDNESIGEDFPGLWQEIYRL